MFPFILTQDLSEVRFELLRDSNWEQRMVSLSKIEDEIKIVAFPTVMHRGDQTHCSRGAHIAALVGAELVAD